MISLCQLRKDYTMGEKNYTKEEVQKIAKSLLGKSYKELVNDDYELNEQQNKGYFGHIIEEEVFHYGKNSKSVADFEEAGIELKVTPYKRNKNGTVSAKERLVLNIINYMEEYKNTFETSHFWSKNKSIQILWYFFENDKKKEDLKITHELLFKFPEDDLEIIKKDWELIMDKVRQGKAHEISESDTYYLGACTKGANSQSVRSQPFSTILAKQRAFSLKSSYMTQLIRSIIKKDKNQKLIDSTLIKMMTFEESLQKELSNYVGLGEHYLIKQFKVNPNSKSKFKSIISKILKVNDIEKSDEFLKANIKVKTIRVEENNQVIESMSFPTFKYEDIIHEDWVNSKIKDYFETTKFMFIVFRKKGNEYFFDKTFFWNMPANMIDDDLMEVWNHTKQHISEGNIIKERVKNRDFTYFWTKKDGKNIHIRPHGQNKKDTYPLPIKDNLTGVTEYMKHCFWINNDYVSELVKQKNK